jgi:hypothetical protein
MLIATLPATLTGDKLIVWLNNLLTDDVKENYPLIEKAINNMNIWLTINQPLPKDGLYENDMAVFYEKMVAKLAAGHPLVAQSNETYLMKGLLGSPYYAVIGFSENNGKQYVKLKNPVSAFDPIFSRNRSSRLEYSSLKHKNTESAVFQLELREFCRGFSQVFIGQSLTKAKMIREVLDDKNRQTFVEVPAAPATAI